MKITRGDIEGRIEELQKLQTNALANANAIGGAIQDCEFWLARMSQEPEEAQAPQNRLRAVHDDSEAPAVEPDGASPVG